MFEHFPVNSTLDSLILVMKDPDDGRMYRIQVGISQGVKITVGPLVEAVQGGAPTATIDLTEAGVMPSAATVTTPVDLTEESLVASSDDELLSSDNESVDSVAAKVSDYFNEANMKQQLKDAAIFDTSTDTISPVKKTAKTAKTVEVKTEVKTEVVAEESEPEAEEEVKPKPVKKPEPRRTGRTGRRSRRVAQSRDYGELDDENDFSRPVKASQDFF